MEGQNRKLCWFIWAAILLQQVLSVSRGVYYNDQFIDTITEYFVKNSDSDTKYKFLTTMHILKQFNTTLHDVVIPGWNNTDGSIGVRSLDILIATQFPCAPAQIATFNTELAYELGVAFGRQAQANKFKLLWGPGLDAYRIPIAGRNFEYYVGEDPYLGEQIVPEIVTGCQSQGIMATLKHYACNDEEINRFEIQIYVDERTLREIYLKPFETAVKESKPACVMESYNGVNGEFNANNKYLLQTILKDEWGFEGFIISDQAAIKDGNASLKAGLDLELNDGSHFLFNTTSLQASIDLGIITEKQLEEKVFRILRQAIRFHILEQKQTNFSHFFPKFDQYSNDVALRSAREGIVLLRNDIGLLPLDKSKNKKIAVLGRTAPTEPPMGSGSAHVYPIAPVSELYGIKKLAKESGSQVDFFPTNFVKFDNASFEVTPGGKQGLFGKYYSNDKFKGKPVLEKVDPNINIVLEPLKDQGVNVSTNWSVHYSGYYYADSNTKDEYMFECVVFQGSYIRLIVDGVNVTLDTVQLQFEDYVWFGKIALEPKKYHKIEFYFASLNSLGATQISLSQLNFGVTTLKVPDVIKEYDAVILSVGFENITNGESVDEPYDLPFYQEQFIKDTLELNEKTVLVTHNGASVKTETYIDKVKTFIHAWYPGQSGGQALAEILYGDVNPSAKLPITWEKRLKDCPASANYPFGQQSPPSINYTEGLFGGYRGYEKNKIQPLFPYGFGLSYTTFSYSDFYQSCGQLYSEEDVLTVSFYIQNTGSVKGAEVSQLYAGETFVSPENPIKTLKGFKKVWLEPGQKKKVVIDLKAKQLAYYDVYKKAWVIKEGKYTLYLGKSSQDIVANFYIVYKKF